MAGQLIAEEGILKGLILSLDNGEEWTLGRDPESCQLLIEDPKASRQHAICRQTDDREIIIENLSNTNRVEVNDVPIFSPTLLKENDKVKIGSTYFRFSSQNLSQESLPPFFSPFKEGMTENRESPYETIFQDSEETLTPSLDLHIRERWLIKIIAGPQSGAEMSVESDKSFVLGNDMSVSDIVFHDMSVSRQHARLTTHSDGSCTIEDLQSRNGTIVDGKPITKTALNSQQVVSLGTTSFVVIDREQASETIFALPSQSALPTEEKNPEATATAEPVSAEELRIAALEAEKEADIRKAHAIERKIITSGGLILTFAILGILTLLGIGMWKLFSSKEAYVEQRDYSSDIDKALAPFPAVSYTYNRATGTLFLVGHVLNPVDKNQLLYNLQGLSFLSNVDDVNVVVDQLVWQEMNNLIAKNPAWNGVNMYSNVPGHFILIGYLKTRKEAGLLTDYINRNFPYIDKLENRVIVEEEIAMRVQEDLFSAGLNSVTVQVTNGEISLTGFIPTDHAGVYQQLIKKWKNIPGIRLIKNLVAYLSPSAAVVDLSDRYRVTGYAKSDDVNVNVIINGRIFTRGDLLDGMTITSIQPHIVYLEKDGLKFKINYNP